MQTNHKNLPGPDTILRKEMPNGMTVLVRENPYSRTVVLNASMPCGSYLDPADKTGLADFTAACLTSGTKTHNFLEISELLESAGASLNIGCGPRAFTFTGSCLSEDLPMLLELLREVIDEPDFPADHLELHRNRMLSSYELHLHDPESMVNERFDWLLFGNTAYGRSDYSTIEEINSITRDDLLNFHRRYVGPKGVILTISGGLPAEVMMEECEKQLGTWQKQQEDINTASYFPQPSAPDHEISEHIEIPEKSETALILGTTGPSRTNPDYIPAVLGNSILGEFGMMGRIGSVVREDNGLAYYASSSITALTYGGCWTIEAGVNPANTEKAIQLIQQELKRFTSQKVSAHELDDVKSYYLGSIPLSLESNSGTAAVMFTMENYRLGLDYLIRLPDLVKRITEEDILETARKWLDPDRLIRITAGTTG